jgi:hypothetical protein
MYLLMSLWPYAAEPYAHGLARVGNALKPDSSQASLELSVPSFDPNAAESFALLFSAHKHVSSVNLSVPIDLRNLAYLPSACAIALAFATPLWRVRRGLWLLGAALALLQVFVVASLATPLVLLLAEQAPLHLIDLTPLAHASLDVLYRALVAPPGMAYAIPGLLWVALLWLSEAHVASNKLA